MKIRSFLRELLYITKGLLWTMWVIISILLGLPFVVIGTLGWIIGLFSNPPWFIEGMAMALVGVLMIISADGGIGGQNTSRAA